MIKDSDKKVMGYLSDNLCPQKAFKVDFDFKSSLLRKIVDIDKAYYMNNTLYILCDCDKRYLNLLPKVGDIVEYTYKTFKGGKYE